eukprot:scaffold160077_cov19-Tisochrysis_lutea.AAC.1
MHTCLVLHRRASSSCSTPFSRAPHNLLISGRSFCAGIPESYLFVFMHHVQWLLAHMRHQVSRHGLALKDLETQQCRQEQVLKTCNSWNTLDALKKAHIGVE